MKTRKFSAVHAIMMVICTVFMLPFFTSCEDGMGAIVEMTDPKPQIIIKTDTITNIVIRVDTLKLPGEIIIKYDTIKVTEIIRDTTYVVKDESTFARGKGSLVKVSDVQYLAKLPIVYKGKEGDLSCNLVVKSWVEEEKPIFVIATENIGNPIISFARSKTSRVEGEYEINTYTITLTHTYSNGYTRRKYNIYEIATWKGMFTLPYGSWSDMYTGTDEALPGTEYNHEGTDGRLFNKILNWSTSFTAAEYEVWDDRAITANQKFFMGKGVIPGGKILIDLIEKSYDKNKTYVITRKYDDKSSSDTTVVNTWGYEYGVVMPSLTPKMYRKPNFGDPTIVNEGAEYVIGGDKIRKNNFIFGTAGQVKRASYIAHTHDIELQYTSLEYTEGGLSVKLSVPEVKLSFFKVDPGTVSNKEDGSRTYEVTPVTFKYNSAYWTKTGNHSTATECWDDKGEIEQLEKILAIKHGFDYVDSNTSYAYAEFHNYYSNGRDELLGKDGINIFNSVVTPDGKKVDVSDFNVRSLEAVASQKVYVSNREAAGKYGKWLVNKYKTVYTTKTNKAEVMFIAYHEEAILIPTKGDNLPMTVKTYTFTDLGMSVLSNLGRVDGKDGQGYTSSITATFNDRSTNCTSGMIELWMKTPNRYGIELAQMSNTWDFNRGAHTVAVFKYYIYENGTLVDGGYKGFVDGKETTKISWTDAKETTKVLSMAQEGGVWTICTVEETPDKKGFVWNSLKKTDNDKVVIKISKNDLQTSFQIQTPILQYYTNENADGTITVSPVDSKWSKGTATAGQF